MAKMRIVCSMLVGVFVLGVVSVASASDIAYYIGGWNPGWYDQSQFDHVDQIIADTSGVFMDVQKFDDKQFAEFEKWVKANMSDDELDVIWLNGCMPSVLYPFPNKQPDGSLAEEWLLNGNMIINVGDWFGYVSYECGGARCAENGTEGAANILNLSPGIITFGDNTKLKKTPEANTYMPSLDDAPVTFRPVVTAEVKGDWEVAMIFASDTGDQSGARADPIVIHNVATDGYLAIINQAANNVWIDRPAAVADFINLWMVKNAVGYLAVEPKGKLTTTWGALKR